MGNVRIIFRSSERMRANKQKPRVKNRAGFAIGQWILLPPNRNCLRLVQNSTLTAR